MGWPFVVSGARELKDGSDGVVRDDCDLVDQGFKECLAGVVRLVREDVSDLSPYRCQVSWRERLGWLFEVEFEFGFAGAQCLGLDLEGVQASADLGCVVVEGAFLEGGEVAVDSTGVVADLFLDGGELFTFRGR
ncbi:hypothetical protein COUCH_11160 [Couchioplanes caeruleus]|uniref:hypothetical protein n=1 Tax=Couchioplanes caeruleus TaxID=56438 RepID=UPI0020BEE113|nr:hypothetical protein [Couchioplanes caeruleus]UQU66782.1 hypothetical protein COUCH_11160 [Couchioplanes caeruleus]